ncbi:MAG: right-handed parallel beta-helix repeat-containing protein [Deltaproteobacteria bacterium]|nr:right-handed parallel beta-helix repeat-containing protein [Deltaproteobacteria bacterium]
MLRLALLVAVAACARRGVVTDDDKPDPPVVACVDPADLGAVPDDDKPDTAAIQRAIDIATAEHKRVCLGRGVFLVERPPRRGQEWGSLMIRSGPIEIAGAGPGTVIRMSGSGRREDWRAIQITGARGVYLHDFTIDGLGAFDTEEQTHLIEVVHGSSDVTINRMTLGPMRRPEQQVGAGIGGDCIRLLGRLGAEVSDVTIANSTLTACDRSGIALQRGLRRIVITHDVITGTGDQSIDFEPTGSGSIEDVIMIGLVIEHHPEAQGPDAIAIGGNGKFTTRRVVLADSKITGGSIRLLDVADVHLLRNRVDGPRGSRAPTISLMRGTTGVRIAGNTLHRPATAPPGPVIAATHLAGRTTRELAIVDNTIEQATPSAVVRLTSASAVEVRRNRLAYRGGDAAMPLINVSAVLGDVAGVSVAENEIAGEASAILVIGNRDHAIKRVDVRGNTAPLVPVSIRCSGRAVAFEQITGDQHGVRKVACRDVQVRERTVAPLPLR